jgi:hypothetical protein
VVSGDRAHDGVEAENGPPLALANSWSLIGLSEAPKSTVCSDSCLMPPPEPIDW